MNRIKVFKNWEDGEKEKVEFFASLSYSERLRYYFKLRNSFNFDKQDYPTDRILKVSYYHNAV